MNRWLSVSLLLTLLLITTAAPSFAAPAPAGLPLAPLPQTGQTGCWDSSGNSLVCATDPLAKGQDGAVRMGAIWPDPRFTINLQADGMTTDGTVTDNLTGIVWLRKPNCFDTVKGVNRDSGGSVSWYDAVTWSSGLADGICGLADGSIPGQWRLPTARELDSLVELQNLHPALQSGHPFLGEVNLTFWSSSSFSEADAWYVYMDYGYVGTDPKGSGYFVWPVRAGL